MRTCKKFVSTLLVVVLVVSSFASSVFAYNIVCSGSTDVYDWEFDTDDCLTITCKTYADSLSLYGFPEEVRELVSDIYIDYEGVDLSGVEHPVMNIVCSEVFAPHSLYILKSSTQNYRYVSIHNFPTCEWLGLPSFNHAEGLYLYDVGISTFDYPLENSFDRFEFFRCDNLTSVVIPGGLEDISINRSPLTELELPDSIKRVQLHEAPDLGPIDLPEELDLLSLYNTGITEFTVLSTYGRVSLCDENLTSVVIGDGREQVDGGLCWICPNLTDVTIPDSVTAIEYNAFYQCSSLASIDIPDSVISIEADAFALCTSLSDVAIPAGIEYIGDNAFAQTAITTATVPEGITKIEYGVFENCKSLESLYLPSTLERVYANFVYRCKNLTDIYFAGTEAEWNNLEFIKNDRRFDHQVDFENMVTINDAIGNAVVHFGKVESNIVINESEHGVIRAFSDTAVEGSTVELDIMADDAYELDTIEIVDADGNPVEFDWDWFTFVMPGSDVEITATFKIADYNIECIDSVEGTVTASADTAQAGTEITLTAVPAFGYKGGAFLVQDSIGRRVRVTDGKFIMPDSSVTVRVLFVEVTNDWYKYEGKWYFLDEDGEAVSGWKNIDGKYYYFDPETGVMTKGWLEDGSSWYYLDSSGAMVKGWKKIDGKWYYFKADGAMVKDGWKKIDGKYYFFNGNGAMQTGWISDGGKWYYLDPSSGAMTTGWIKISGKWYYMNADGSMATGWKKIRGVYYYLEDSGAMHTGWLTYNNDMYWLDETSGAMACGTTVTIDGVDFEFDGNGACLNPPIAIVQ